MLSMKGGSSTVIIFEGNRIQMKRIRVVAAVIRDGDRIFATARGYGEFKG